MSMQQGGRPPGSGQLRASAADRDRAIDVLKAAFAEGRLTMPEYEERTGLALSSRTYADLARLTADLPAGPLGSLQPQLAVAGQALASPRVNGLAIASLVLALVPVVPAPVTVILGFVARSQIRRTGERGAGLAAAAITISCAVMIAAVLYVVLHHA
jgi:hypothetical protein